VGRVQIKLVRVLPLFVLVVPIHPVCAPKNQPSARHTPHRTRRTAHNTPRVSPHTHRHTRGGSEVTGPEDEAAAALLPLEFDLLLVEVFFVAVVLQRLVPLPLLGLLLPLRVPASARLCSPPLTLAVRAPCVSCSVCRACRACACRACRYRRATRRRRRLRVCGGGTGRPGPASSFCRPPPLRCRTYTPTGLHRRPPRRRHGRRPVISHVSNTRACCACAVRAACVRCVCVR
jgi:hypothetical protein